MENYGVTPTTGEVKDTVATPTTEEVKDAVATPTTEEVKSTVATPTTTGEVKEAVFTIPYKRFKEVNDKLKQLQEELKIAKIKADKYDRAIEFYEKNPELKKRMVQAFEEYSSDNNVEEYSDMGKSEIELLKEEIREIKASMEAREIKEQLSKKLEEVNAVILKEKFPFTTKDVIEVMEERNIGDPFDALKILMGENIKVLETQWLNKLKNQPSGSPSFEGLSAGNLPIKKHSTLREACDWIRKNIHTIVQKE